jgi:hypothetical protein
MEDLGVLLLLLVLVFVVSIDVLEDIDGAMLGGGGGGVRTLAD